MKDGDIIDVFMVDRLLTAIYNLSIIKMNSTLTNLIKVQTLLAIMTVLITAIFVPEGWKSILAGSSISILTSCAIKLMWRRIPVVVRPYDFYGAMIISEVVKWLIVIALATLYLKMKFSALGILLGFSITYIFSYAIIWLRK